MEKASESEEAAARSPPPSEAEEPHSPSSPQQQQQPLSPPSEGNVTSNTSPHPPQPPSDDALPSLPAPQPTIKSPPPPKQLTEDPHQQPVSPRSTPPLLEQKQRVSSSQRSPPAWEKPTSPVGEGSPIPVLPPPGWERKTSPPAASLELSSPGWEKKEMVTYPVSPVSAPSGWEKPVFEGEDSASLTTQPALTERVDSKVNEDTQQIQIGLPRWGSSEVKPSDMGQMVCGSCRELLYYPRSASLIKCPCCQIVNYVLEEHLVGNVNCGKCSVLLMYPYGSPSVRCSCCRFVTEIGPCNKRPRLSELQGHQPPSQHVSGIDG